MAEAFVKAGVPRENIVLGFHPEHIRQYTGFAVS
ncbi:element excision factor XisI family protein [Spirosoma koreense]